MFIFSSSLPSGLHMSFYYFSLPSSFLHFRLFLLFQNLETCDMNNSLTSISAQWKPHSGFLEVLAFYLASRAFSFSFILLPLLLFFPVLLHLLFLPFALSFPLLLLLSAYSLLPTHPRFQPSALSTHPPTHKPTRTFLLLTPT